MTKWLVRWRRKRSVLTPGQKSKSKKNETHLDSFGDPPPDAKREPTRVLPEKKENEMKERRRRSSVSEWSAFLSVVLLVVVIAHSLLLSLLCSSPLSTASLTVQTPSTKQEKNRKKRKEKKRKKLHIRLVRREASDPPRHPIHERAKEKKIK